MILGSIILIFNIEFFFEWLFFWFNSLWFEIYIYIDWKSIIFIFIVLLISSIVLFFRKFYIIREIFLDRFIILVLFFIISIFILIFSLNLVFILLGWDGLGLTSFCLVIYYQNVKSFNSAVLTFLVNRLGDVFIIIRICFIISYGSWSFIFLRLKRMDFNLKLIFSLIILAAITKRAQIPFSSWLPAAIAAPTPVSALVHSSTLVTAGVYLLIRFGEFLFLELIYFLLILALLTIFIAGFRALIENDLKKNIALSTLSQLGLIIRCLGLGFVNLTFFHLVVHALFKSLIFIGAGRVIHRFNRVQNLNFIGMVILNSPYVSILINFSNLALIGFPYISGFYSKDLILEKFMIIDINYLIFFLFFFSIRLTFCYSLRVLVLRLFIKFKGNSLVLLNFQDKYIMISIFILGGISIFRGSLLLWLIFPYPDLVFLSLSFKLIVNKFLIVGLFISLILINLNLLKLKKFKKIFYLRGLMWFLSNLLVLSFRKLFFFFRKILSKLEYSWIERFGGQGLNKFILGLRNFNIYFYREDIKRYILIFFLFFILIILIIIII